MHGIELLLRYIVATDIAARLLGLAKNVIPHFQELGKHALRLPRTREEKMLVKNKRALVNKYYVYVLMRQPRKRPLRYFLNDGKTVVDVFFFAVLIPDGGDRPIQCILIFLTERADMTTRVPPSWGTLA